MNLIALECPWCGATRIEASAYLNSANFKMWRARCKNCGANGPSKHESGDALKAWDKRKDIQIAEVGKNETPPPFVTIRRPDIAAPPPPPNPTYKDLARLVLTALHIKKEN